MGYLYFYSEVKKCINLILKRSRPLWGIYISIQHKDIYDYENVHCSRPLWGIYISILFQQNKIKYCYLSSRPLWGIYISIRNIVTFKNGKRKDRSRPLWGIYISIQPCAGYYIDKSSSRPLWGIYISIL